MCGNGVGMIDKKTNMKERERDNDSVNDMHWAKKRCR